jgi:glycosyltransferase involved in cell wall biosynthesis
MSRSSTGKRIAFLLDNLAGGGAEQVILNLASGFFSLGYKVDLLVCSNKGELVDKVPEGVNLVEVGKTSTVGALATVFRADKSGLGLILTSMVKLGKLPGALKYVAAISRYLASCQPAALVAALPKSNINAVLARKLAEVSLRLLVGVHIQLSALEKVSLAAGKSRMRHLRPLMQRYYKQADCIVAVSKGVADDAVSYLGVGSGLVNTIYNPVSVDGIDELIAEDPGHPWLSGDRVPVVLGIGRFVEQKNFPLLLRAFALVRKIMPLKLILLGGDTSSAEQRRQGEELMELACKLDIADDIDLLGYVHNPYAYLSRASMFVLSSRFEGFGNVLIEALLCGCPVVSTDCPSGPAEILERGRFGRLVPVNDMDGLARAMQETLGSNVDKAMLRSRGQEFSVSRAVFQYEKLLFGE